MPRVTGTFDVTVTPDGSPDEGPGATLARMALEKQYHGALDAVATGRMLSAVTGTKGSAGYVALERVTGTLEGRSGSFALQHSGTMHEGAQELTIKVVPDSGTDDLTGLRGTLRIRIEGYAHFYDFDYVLE